MTERPGRSLTRHEFDAVIRRAAELATSDAESLEAELTEVDLFRIAGEVGLSESNVRRALSEVRSGEAGGKGVDRLFGPAFVAASRVVPGTPERIADEMDEFFVSSQLLQSVRRSTNFLQYRPAVDWASQLARAASFSSRKYYVASAKSVEVRLEAVDETRTLVEIIVDPGTRTDHFVGAVLGGGTSGGVVGTVTGIVVASAAPVGLAVGAGILVGGMLWTGIGYAVGVSHRKKLVEVRTELEGVLDALEFGDSLQPPPPSWRRWVKRHFHGVARDVIRDNDDDD